MLYRVMAPWVSGVLDAIENPSRLVILLIKVVVDDRKSSAPLPLRR